jgi:hypothetical protein
VALRSTPIALAAVVVALVAAAAPARAQSVEACYTPSGSLYLIKQPGAPTVCSSTSHKQITLAAAGPTGPQGPTGPTGPAGPVGPTGPSGPLSGLEFHSGTTNMVPSGSANFGIFIATCAAGKSVMNFGFDPAPGNSGFYYASRPAINGKQLTWGLTAPANTAWTVYWTCVDGLLP